MWYFPITRRFYYWKIGKSKNMCLPCSWILYSRPLKCTSLSKPKKMPSCCTMYSCSSTLNNFHRQSHGCSFCPLGFSYLGRNFVTWHENSAPPLPNHRNNNPSFLACRRHGTGSFGVCGCLSKMVPPPKELYSDRLWLIPSPYW